MNAMQQQLKHLRKELRCSTALEYSSPHVWVCSVFIPWCGRSMHWQLLLPTTPHAAPDLVFDDDSFQPLIASAHPPRPHASLIHQPTSHPETGAAAPASPAALRSLLRSWSSELAGRPDGLTRLVKLLLELFRAHQVRRLEAAAARLPRLQFELSTLELTAGMQLELQQQQASFALPLPAVDLSRLLEVAEAYGAQLPASSSAPAQPTQPGRAAASGGGATGAGAGGQAAAGCSPGPPADNDDILEPLDPEEHHEEASRARRQPPAAEQRAAEADRANNLAGAAGAAVGPHSGAGGTAALQRPQLVLLASFRLPPGVVAGAGGGSGGGGAGGDLSDPDLSLQLPPVLNQLKAFPASHHCPAAVSSASTSATTVSSAGGTGANTSLLIGPGASSPSSGPSSALSTPPAPGSAAAAASAAPGAVSLVPSFQLPLWSQHMCLAEYVPLASERLEAQLEAHCTLLANRQQILEHLGEMLGPPLELNLLGGSALFSLAWEGAPLLAAVELGPRFPADKPIIVLQSVRQLNAPDASRTFKDYPWSPRWAPREMAARIHNWMREELPNFMRGRTGS